MLRILAQIQIIVALAASAILALVLSAVPASAAKKVHLRPRSLSRAEAKKDAFAAYRTNPYKAKRGEDRFWYDQQALDSIGARYATMSKLREARRNYMQSTLQDEHDYMNQNGEMVEWYVRQTARNHGRAILRDFRKALVNDFRTSRRESRRASPGCAMKVTRVAPMPKALARAAKKPGKARAEEPSPELEEAEDDGNDVSVEEALQSVVHVGENLIERHQPITFSSDTEARVRFDLPRTTARVDFVSPVVDADAQYRVGSGHAPLSGATGPVLSDRATVGISRGFSQIAMSTGVRYGVDSGSLNYGVTKHIHGPLSAGVYHSQSLKNAAADNTMVQLNVGMGF